MALFLVITAHSSSMHRPGGSIFRAVLAVSIALLAGCSPSYVLRAGYEQARIIACRKDIKDLIEQDRLPDDQLNKLALVLDAREFAISIGLEPREAFTTFVQLDRPAAAWVVSASRKDAFILYRWWFPVVGSVPYKGFFSPQEAEEEGRDLEEKGLETWIRDTDAFSTLGWFSDPILSTTLSHHPSQIVNTVLHESLHATVWFRDRVELNESLANFVGTQASIEFFEKRKLRCATEACREAEEENLRVAQGILDRSKALEATLETLHTALNELYRSNRPISEKLAERELIFDRNVAPLRGRYPGMRILAAVNNAEVLQLRLYFSGTAQFQRTFEESSRDWSKFLQLVRQMGLKTKAGR